MDFEIIRSGRKTIAVEVTTEGEVLVRVPLRLARREVAAFVDRHRGWIARKLAQAEAQRERQSPRQFVQGESFPFLGEMIRLRLVEGAEYLRRDNGEFLLGADLVPRAPALFRKIGRAHV